MVSNIHFGFKKTFRKILFREQRKRKKRNNAFSRTVSTSWQQSVAAGQLVIENARFLIYDSSTSSTNSQPALLTSSWSAAWCYLWKTVQDARIGSSRRLLLRRNVVQARPTARRRYDHAKRCGDLESCHLNVTVVGASVYARGIRMLCFRCNNNDIIYNNNNKF